MPKKSQINEYSDALLLWGNINSFLTLMLSNFYKWVAQVFFLEFMPYIPQLFPVPLWGGPYYFLNHYE